MRKKGSGERTLLASVLLSAPGPLVLGLALLSGRSATQLADLVRRSAELVAIAVSWLVYRRFQRGPVLDAAARQRLETLAQRSVGLAMCFSGLAMVLIAWLSPPGDKGNVIPALVIAVLGVITNTWFWLRYRRLNHHTPDAIMAVQSRLYGAKSLVDTCVTAALLVVAAAPLSPAARWADMAGSAVVSLYLIFSGAKILSGQKARPAAREEQTIQAG